MDLKTILGAIILFLPGIPALAIAFFAIRDLIRYYRKSERTQADRLAVNRRMWRWVNVVIVYMYLDRKLEPVLEHFIERFL